MSQTHSMRMDDTAHANLNPVEPALSQHTTAAGPSSSAPFVGPDPYPNQHTVPTESSSMGSTSVGSSSQQVTAGLGSLPDPYDVGIVPSLQDHLVPVAIDSPPSHSLPTNGSPVPSSRPPLVEALLPDNDVVISHESPYATWAGAYTTRMPFVVDPSVAGNKLATVRPISLFSLSVLIDS